MLVQLVGGKAGSTKAPYYEILERTQQGTMDVTPWIKWFLECLGRAIDEAQNALGIVLEKRVSGIESETLH